MSPDGPLLICYDGSEGALAALDAAARLFADRDAVVACFWEPFASSSKRFAVDLLELVQDAENINEREEQLAQQIAEEGALAAGTAGLTADGRAVKTQTSIDEAILTYADELDAAAIVLGARSRSSLRSLLIGDVANEVVQRAARPVFVVPTSQLARRRRDELTRETSAERE